MAASEKEILQKKLRLAKLELMKKELEDEIAEAQRDSHEDSAVQEPTAISSKPPVSTKKPAAVTPTAPAKATEQPTRSVPPVSAQRPRLATPSPDLILDEMTTAPSSSNSSSTDASAAKSPVKTAPSNGNGTSHPKPNGVSKDAQKHAEKQPAKRTDLPPKPSAHDQPPSPKRSPSPDKAKVSDNPKSSATPANTPSPAEDASAKRASDDGPSDARRNKEGSVAASPATAPSATAPSAVAAATATTMKPSGSVTAVSEKPRAETQSAAQESNSVAVADSPRSREEAQTSSTVKQTKPAPKKRPSQPVSAATAAVPAATAVASAAAPHTATVSDAKVANPDAEAEPEDAPEEEPVSSGGGFALRTAPPWLISLIIHVVGLIVLGLFTFSLLKEEAERIIIASAVTEQDDPIEEFAEIDMEIEEMEVQDVSSQSFDMVDPGASSFADIAQPVQNADSAGMDNLEPMQTTIGEIGNLFGTDGAGMADIGDGLKASGTFFGKKAQGNKFVFVVDNSLSMNKGRFTTALNEMVKSIEQMSPKQQFYIIFFSDTAYPMFHPNPAPGLVPATTRNKERVHAWLYTVERCLKTKGEEALKHALSLRPDVIYILGDGAFTDKTGPMLTAPHNRRTIIHTFGMEVNQRGRTELMSIAQANRGNFTPVAADPRAAKADTTIPNHRKKGAVWGIALPP